MILKKDEALREENLETSASVIDLQKCCSTTTSTKKNDGEELGFSLMMLIIEGRKPDTNSTRGYKEGIHVINNNHKCSLKLIEVSFVYYYYFI